MALNFKENTNANRWIIFENYSFQWKYIFFFYSKTIQFWVEIAIVFASLFFRFWTFSIQNCGCNWMRIVNRWNLYKESVEKHAENCIKHQILHFLEKARKKWNVGGFDTWADAVKRMSDNGCLPRFKNRTNTVECKNNRHTLGYWPCATFSPHFLLSTHVAVVVENR